MQSYQHRCRGLGTARLPTHTCTRLLLPKPTSRDVLTERRIEAARSEMAAAAPLSCVVCMAAPRDTFLNCGHLVCRWGCWLSGGFRQCIVFSALQPAPTAQPLELPISLTLPSAERAASAWRPARCAGRPSPPGRARLCDCSTCMQLRAVSCWLRIGSTVGQGATTPKLHVKQGIGTTGQSSSTARWQGLAASWSPSPT